MSTKRCTDEFKIEPVRQIVEYGRPVAELAERLHASNNDVMIPFHVQHGAGDVQGNFWVVLLVLAGSASAQLVYKCVNGK